MTTDADKPIVFPPPLGGWGTITHMAVANPKWRWWAFWRPRTIVLQLDPLKAIDGCACHYCLPEGSTVRLTISNQ